MDKLTAFPTYRQRASIIFCWYRRQEDLKQNIFHTPADNYKDPAHLLLVSFAPWYICITTDVNESGYYVICLSSPLSFHTFIPLFSAKVHNQLNSISEEICILNIHSKQQLNHFRIQQWLPNLFSPMNPNPARYPTEEPYWRHHLSIVTSQWLPTVARWHIISIYNISSCKKRSRGEGIGSVVPENSGTTASI